MPIDTEVYDREGGGWWEEDNPLNVLHGSITPGRLAYFRQVLGRAPELRCASQGQRRTSLAGTIDELDRAADARLVCLGAEGFWLVDGGVQSSLDHILDPSDVVPRNPRTNASIAKGVIENSPEDPSRFAVELVMVSIAHPCPCCGHLTFDEPPGSYSICPVCFWEDDAG